MQENCQTLEKKSADNKKAADLLCDNSYFAQAVHCAYYSCFQMVMYLLRDTPIVYKCKETEKGLHNRKICSFKVSFASRVSDKMIVSNVITKLKQLKDLRTKADYLKERISKDEAKEAINMAEEILKEINI